MRFLYIASFIACFSFNSFAQTVDNTGAELIKRFKATLAESRKQQSTPILPELDTNAGKKLDYVVPEHLIAVKYPDPRIRPLRMPKAKEADPYGFYAKAGIGYPISPLIELSYHNKESDVLRFGTNFKHLSSQGNVENQNFSNTSFDLGGTYFIPEMPIAAGGRLGFNLDNYRFFGYHQLAKVFPDSLNPFPTDSLEIPKDSVDQRFFEFFGNVHLFNYKSNDALFNYGANIDFHILNDAYGARELVLAPHFEVEKWLGKYRNKHRLFADLDINYASFNQDSTGAGRTLINFHPGVDFNFGMFKARLATNVGSSEGNFFIFPDIDLNVNLANGKFNAYAGWSGEMKTNTFRSLTTFNPFMASEIELRHTGFSEFFGGLRGNISRIGYDFRAGYAMTNNMLLFLNDPASDFLRFTPIYDSLNVINFKGSVDFEMVENLTVLAALGYNIYTGGSQSRAYHLPIFESNFALLYAINGLELKAELFVNAGVPYVDAFTGDDEMLNGLFDLNFGLAYWTGQGQKKKKKAAKGSFGFFLDVNNVLNNKYQRWYLYPQLGINARVGIMAKF